MNWVGGGGLVEGLRDQLNEGCVKSGVYFEGGWELEANCGWVENLLYLIRAQESGGQLP